MGAPKPQALELVPNSDRRTPTARDSARRNYQRLLERVLTRSFIGSKVDGLRSAMDLEHSFGPAYVRGHLLRGTAAEAVIGVSEAESASTIDGILTLGILWLDYCRQKTDARRHFGGLKVVVPQGIIAHYRRTHGMAQPRRRRFSALHARRAQRGTRTRRLPRQRQPDSRASCMLFLARLRSNAASPASTRSSGSCRLTPNARIEIHPRSATDVGLMLHGLEFARVRHGAASHSFSQQQEITFGAGANETPLTDETEALCRELCARLFLSRHREGAHKDPLFRMQPERWLESEFRAGLSDLLPSLRGDQLYSQVPALSSGDRGMLDLLTIDRNDRLVVIELKADEDLHLPLQALDYWIRVRALNADRQRTVGSDRPLSAFEREGYFPGAEVSPLAPRLLLAAPALRIHPANLPVLRYLSPEIDWELIALSEHWRQQLQIVFRKHPTDAHAKCPSS